MTKLPVCGRGRLQACADITRDGALIRIDSDSGPQHWAELHLSAPLLRELLRQIEAAHPQRNGTVVVASDGPEGK